MRYDKRVHNEYTQAVKTGVVKPARTKNVFYFERRQSPCTVSALATLKGWSFETALERMRHAAELDYRKNWRTDFDPEKHGHRNWWFDAYYDRARVPGSWVHGYRSSGLVQVFGDYDEAHFTKQRQGGNARTTVAKAAARWPNCIVIVASPRHAVAVVDGTAVEDWSTNTPTGRSKQVLAVFAAPGSEVDEEVETKTEKPKSKSKKKTKRLSVDEMVELGYRASTLKSKGWSLSQIQDALKAPSRSAVWNWIRRYETDRDERLAR